MGRFPVFADRKRFEGTCFGLSLDFPLISNAAHFAEMLLKLTSRERRALAVITLLFVLGLLALQIL